MEKLVFESDFSSESEHSEPKEGNSEEVTSGDERKPENQEKKSKICIRSKTDNKRRRTDEKEEVEVENSDSDSVKSSDRKRKSPIKKEAEQVLQPASDEYEDDEEFDEDEEEDDSDEHNFYTNGVPPKGFETGAFVFRAVDIKTRDDPPLWRIDSKSLLQKYLPYKEGEKTLYKRTSSYLGWIPEYDDEYLPQAVTLIVQSKNETIVELTK